MKNSSKQKTKRQVWYLIPAILGALIWAVTPLLSSSAAVINSFSTLVMSDTRIEASLSGSPINGTQPFGRAEYRASDNGSRRLTIEGYSVSLPGGTVLTVSVNNSPVGQMVINSFGSGILDIRTDQGQTVPTVSNGMSVTVSNNGSGVLSGVFGITTGSPSPSPSGSPSGSPSPTGSPNGTPSPSPTGTASPSPTGTPTGSPSPSPTGSPTGSPSPSPSASPSPSPGFGDIFATLSGAPINGGVPRGFSEYSLHQSGTNRRIRVFVNSVSLPAGTVLSVNVANTNLGQFTLQSNGYGEFRIESRDNPNVPVVSTGTPIQVNNGGTTILSGTFTTGVSPSPSPSPTASPSPTGSPTGSPSPSPTGSPSPSPSPSPSATPSARLFNAELTGAQVVPQNNSTARGSARILVDDTGGEVQVVLSFFGLSSNQTTATINGAALPGTNAPEILNLGQIGGTNGFFPTRRFVLSPTQLAQLRSGVWYVSIGSVNNPEGEIRGQIHAENQISDFEGDGRSDLAVFRPTDGNWYFLNSSDNSFRAQSLGSASDKVVAGDYDGDGVGDATVFKAINGYGYWQTRRSADDAVTTEQWGLGDDKPVSADFDGDGRNDLAVFRPSNGVWYIRRSSNGSLLTMQWGTSEDRPVAGDFDGDGRADIAVFRPSNGIWYINRSSNNSLLGLQWGISEDIPASGDFDGDGQSDVAVFRPSNGTWYIRRSLDGAMKAVQFGTAGDIPVAGGYDADGKTDIAVFRPSNGYWYIIRSVDDGFVATQFGQNGDKPAAAQQ